MNREEFMEMHANCVACHATYFVEVEKTSTMLAGRTAEPLTFRERFRLMCQGIVENDAHWPTWAPAAFSSMQLN
jgi:hypothetical protein